jgi:tetratricopeptide (TPR) repeat protein
MKRFNASVYRWRCVRIAARLVVVTLLFASLAVQGQSVSDYGPIWGTVRDGRGIPVADASVFLKWSGGTESLTTRTNAEGIYRFAKAPRPGMYELRAEKTGYGEVILAAISLARGEGKKVDLTLADFPPSESKHSAAGAPQFFDEPHFTVAGVTDTTNLGGHGSDAVVRNKEALAKATVSLGNESPAVPASGSSVSRPDQEKSLRVAAAKEPADFDANHQLGALLVSTGRAEEALLYLDRAAKVEPDDYENSYTRTLAQAESGNYEGAGAGAKELLAHHDNADLHHLLADAAERLGKPLEAVREYQRAAELNASEPNLFDWGAELLMHRAIEPAIEVFTKGNRLFPASVRMLIGLGVAEYSNGATDRAILHLSEASDLKIDDPEPYQFLGRIQSSEATTSEVVLEKLQRFARLRPDNAQANYYYAAALWQRKKTSRDAEQVGQVKELLEKAIRLDPKLAVGYLQLGVLYSEQGDLSRAIDAYQRSIDVNPQQEEAHYRLAQAYRQSGDRSKAKAQLQLYEAISKDRAQQVEREHHEVQQFVYQLKDRSAGQAK